MAPHDELIQIAERQLAEAEEAYRRDPSTANEQLIMKRWDAVREARGDTAELRDVPPWWPRRMRRPLDSP